MTPPRPRQTARNSRQAQQGRGLSTGRLGIDATIGINGIPRGAITEVYGGAAAGKTTFALHLAAEIQRRGGLIAYIDAEHTLSSQHCRSVGMNLSATFVGRPSSGEEALDVARRLVASGGLDLLVLDTAAALVPAAEANTPFGVEASGALRDLLDQGLRKLERAAIGSGTAVLVLNQACRRQLRGMTPQEQSVGGWSLPLRSSLRIYLRLLGALTEGGKRVGSRIRLQVVKNRRGLAGAASDLDLRSCGGFSEAADLLELGLTLAVVRRQGGCLEWREDRFPGRPAFLEWLDRRPERVRVLRDELSALVGSVYSAATTVSSIVLAKLGP